MHILLITLLLNLHSKLLGFTLHNSLFHRERISSKSFSYHRVKMDANEFESPSLEQLFGGSNGVMYIQHDPASISNQFVNEEDKNRSQSPTISSSSSAESIMSCVKSKMILELPLMPCTTPLFPLSKEMLHIYEMKYRSLMNDAQNSANNGSLGRCYVSSTGNIGSIGSLCSIIEKKVLNDGQAFYIIQSITRFKIIEILQSEPYLLAKVEFDYEDTMPSIAEFELNEVLCVEIYTYLKIHLRLAKLQCVEDETKLLIEISPSIRDSRPTVSSSGSIGCNDGDIDVGVVHRHTTFSHACCSLLSTEPCIMQQLLQSDSTTYRLHGIKRILEEAISELTSLLLDDGMITSDELQSIREFALTNEDSDLLPDEDNDGISIEDELNNAMLTELGGSTLDEDFSLDDLENQLLLSDLDAIFGIEVDDLNVDDDLTVDGLVKEGKDEEEEDVDEWARYEADAFQ